MRPELQAVAPFPPFDLAGEEALLHGLRAGSDDAFESLVRSHSGRLLAVARRFLPEEDARDAVQETFISAFRSIDRFQGGSRISTWLHRIVVNAALMKVRTRKRKPEESIEDLLPGFLEDGHSERPYGEWGETGELALEKKELRAMVRGCIERLPEPYRNVLMLRDIEELDTEETARILETSPNAVKTRLHRARQALRTLIERQLKKA